MENAFNEDTSSRDLSWDGDKPSANCRLFVNEECVTRFVIVPPRTCIEFYLEREVKLATYGTRELSGGRNTSIRIMGVPRGQRCLCGSIFCEQET